MNETTTRRIPAGGRSPEFDHAMGILQSLRADLLDDALAYRPMPPLPADARLVRRLPRRIRGYAVWARHAAVAAAALMTLAATHEMGVFFGAGLLPRAAVLLTLVRPVAAFWLSLVSPLPYAFFGSSGDGWPWPPVVFFAHLVVMTVVAARTRRARPRGCG